MKLCGGLRKKVLSCEICGNLCTNSPCRICSDPKRDKSVLCVVEGVDDILALERSQVYRGSISCSLVGTLSAFGGQVLLRLWRLNSLKRRVFSANGAGTGSGAPMQALTQARTQTLLQALTQTLTQARAQILLQALTQTLLQCLNANSTANLGRGEQKVREVILALSATVEGQTTAHYIADMLKASDCRLSVLGQGLPIGGSLNYLDDGTLFAAFRSRSEISPAPPCCLIFWLIFAYSLA